MQDRADAVHGVQMQDRLNAVYRLLQYRSDAGEDVCRTGHMEYRTNAVQDGCRTG